MCPRHQICVTQVGTALLTTVAAASGRPAARFLLREQFVHKALLLVLQARRVAPCGAV